MADENTNESEREQPEPQPQAMEKTPPVRLTIGVGLAIIGCLVGAVLWALITVATGYQIGYMAVGVGFLVGFAIRYGAKGQEPWLRPLGAGLALLGCLLGNLFTVYLSAAKEVGLPLNDVVGIVSFDKALGFMASGFQIIDLLFYAIAIYEGWKLSVKATA